MNLIGRKRGIEGRKRGKYGDGLARQDFLKILKRENFEEGPFRHHNSKKLLQSSEQLQLLGKVAT